MSVLQKSLSHCGTKLVKLNLPYLPACLSILCVDSVLTTAEKHIFTVCDVPKEDYLEAFIWGKKERVVYAFWCILV